jgi:hypothetical protein
MLLNLLVLTAALTTRGVLASEHARSLADDAAEVVAGAEEQPLFPGSDGREKTARLLIVWAAHESAGHVNILGDCTNPSKKSVETCNSIGRMQTSKAWIHEIGFTSSEVLASGRLSLRIGLEVMRRLRDQCGSVRSGLRAYASGSCAGTIRARALVEARCKEIGGC